MEADSSFKSFGKSFKEKANDKNKFPSKLFQVLSLLPIPAVCILEVTAYGSCTLFCFINSFNYF